MTQEEKSLIIDKWLQIISDDYMHFEPEQFPIVKNLCMLCSIKEYEDKGAMMWLSFTDIDCKRKTSSLLFYVKPEYRGSKLFLTMIKNLETISKEEGATEIIIGASSSGYKTEKFNTILQRFGYKQAGYVKGI